MIFDWVYWSYSFFINCCVEAQLELIHKENINKFITLKVQLLEKFTNQKVELTRNRILWFPCWIRLTKYIDNPYATLTTLSVSKEIYLQYFSQFKTVQTFLRTLYVAPKILPNISDLGWWGCCLFLSKHKSTYEIRDILCI